MKPASQATTILRRLLTIVGIGLMIAFVFAAMPVGTFSGIHHWLGLGQFPDCSVTVYLARSTSLLYGIHGLVMFYVGRNLPRLIDVAQLLGWIHVGMGFAILWIDLNAQMPWWWISFEGLPITATGLIIVWISRAADKGKPAAES